MHSGELPYIRIHLSDRNLKGQPAEGKRKGERWSERSEQGSVPSTRRPESFLRLASSLLSVDIEMVVGFSSPSLSWWASLLILVIFLASFLPSSSCRVFPGLGFDLIPEEWRPSSPSALVPASPSAPVFFTVALRERNLDVLESAFWSVSDPRSASYQQYWTPEQINELTAPPQEVVKKVLQWLSQGGIPAQSMTIFPTAIQVETTVEVASALFNTAFYSFSFSLSSPKKAPLKEETTQIALDPYEIPDSLDTLIEMVLGLSMFPPRHLKVHSKGPRPGSKDPKATNIDIAVVPQSLYILYNIDRPQVVGKARNSSQGVIEFSGFGMEYGFLNEYSKQANLPLSNISLNHMYGNYHGHGMESLRRRTNTPQSNPYFTTQSPRFRCLTLSVSVLMLFSSLLCFAVDIELMMGVNRESDPWFWMVTLGRGWLYEFGTQFINAKEVPQVVSISYAGWEGAQCQWGNCTGMGVNATGYVALCDVLFQKIGLRGTSVLGASGDNGALSSSNSNCQMPLLLASYPAVSRYVTSVGATEMMNPVYQLPNASSIPLCSAVPGLQCFSGGEEVAVSYPVSSYNSGGGFSNMTLMPAYQQAAVKAYLKSGVVLPPASYFNPHGRAHPDIAAIGHKQETYRQKLSARPSLLPVCSSSSFFSSY